MTPGDTLPQPNCGIDLFCSLGLPNLETGWCVCYNRGGDPVNFVIALFPRDWGSNLTVLSMFSCSLGLPNLETGWCVCYNRGGDPVNFVIDVFPQFHCVVDRFIIKA